MVADMFFTMFLNFPSGKICAVAICLPETKIQYCISNCLQIIDKELVISNNVISLACNTKQHLCQEVKGELTQSLKIKSSFLLHV